MTHGTERAWPGNVVSLWPDGQAPPRGPTMSTARCTGPVRVLSWDSAALMRSLVDSGDDVVEVLDPSATVLLMSGTAECFHGGHPETEEPWLLMWPGDARGAVETALAVARTGPAARFREWRQTIAGDLRWLDVVVTRMDADDGALLGFVAVSRDMTDLKVANDALELQSRELSHRFRNVFALLIGLVTLSARDTPAAQPYARTLRDRFGALSRALDYLQVPRPGTQAVPPKQSLQGLLHALLTPYDLVSEGVSRFHFLGVDDTPIGSGSVTSVAMVIHEIATNAVKYGALSEKAGFVRIDCRRAGDALRLTWDERDGPTIEHPPARSGFGSTLVQRSIRGQLGGTIALEWRHDGLMIVVDMSVAALAT